MRESVADPARGFQGFHRNCLLIKIDFNSITLNTQIQQSNRNDYSIEIFAMCEKQDCKEDC